MKKICGDFGGINAKGKECGMPAGWGANRSEGRCRNHPEERLVCGDFGGINAKGKECGMPAGWGTGKHKGRCQYHPEEQREKSTAPPNMKVLPGGKREKTETDSDESADGDIEKPEFLEGVADEEFDRVIKALRTFRVGKKTVYHDVDSAAILNYALAYYFMMWAAKELHNEGLTYLDTNNGGTVRKNPAFQIWRDSQNAMATWGDRLGLSPKARDQLKVDISNAVNEDDPLGLIG